MESFSGSGKTRWRAKSRLSHRGSVRCVCSRLGFCGLVLLVFRVWEFMALQVNAHVNEKHVDIFTNPPNQMELLSYMSTAFADKLPCPKLIWSPGP